MAVKVLAFDDAFTPPKAVFLDIASPAVKTSLAAALYRPMRQVSANATLTATDGGVICTTAGIQILLEAHSYAQDGNPYSVKNASSGDVTVNVASGECIKTASGNVASLGIPVDHAREFIRNASSPTEWIVQ